MLKGKCKTDFEEWYIKAGYSSFGMEFYNPASDEPEITSLDFCDYPFIMQTSVYLQFFREKGIDIVIGFVYEFTENPKYFYQISDGVERKSDCKSYPDYNTALTQAITQAGEIYNKEK